MLVKYPLLLFHLFLPWLVFHLVQIYSMVHDRMIPCYKNGKKLYFFEDELLEWITKGKKKTMHEIEMEAQANFKKRPKGIRV